MSDSNNNNNNSASLFDFSTVPAYLRASSDFDSSSLAPPSLHASQSTPYNSLESTVYRGLREHSATVTLPTFDHLNNSFNANQSYWLNPKSSNQTSGKKDLSVSFQTLTVSSNPSIQLKSEPAYIERYTSFYTTASLSELIDTIQASLTTHAVDFSLTKEKAKFQCVFYDCFNNAVQFLIKIYKANSGEDTKLVEFQRRYGCCVAYNRAYQTIYQSIQSIKTPYIQQFNSIPCEPNNLTTINPLLPHPKPTLDESALNSLCSMASSNELCAARESLRCLSATNLKQTCEKSNDAIQLIVQTMANVFDKPIKDDEQERCAAQILAQVAELNSSRNLIIVKLLNNLLSCLDAPITKSNLTSSTGCLQSRCTKRYLAVIFNELAQSEAKLLKSLFMSNEESMNILKKFEFVIDTQVSDNIKNAIQLIESA